MEPFSPDILFITPRKNGNPPPMNSQECFLQQVLGFDWFVTREDCAIPTIHFQQFTSCLSPLFFLGNPVSIIMNDIYLFVCISIRSETYFIHLCIHSVKLCYLARTGIFTELNQKFLQCWNRTKSINMGSKLQSMSP